MKKILTLLLIVSFGMIPIVKAESLTSDYWSNYMSFENRTQTYSNQVNGTLTTKTINFSSNLDVSNYNNFIGRILVANTIDSKTYSNNLPNYMNCQHTQSYGQSGSIYTITYADGTHATISGQDYDYLCDQWYISSQIQSYYQYNFDNSPLITITLIDTSNKYYQCMLDNIGNFSCPGGHTYKTMNIGLYSSGITSTYKAFLVNDFNKIVSDTQQIINNNNSNTQTIHNDNQQQYNFISNSTIDTTTTDDALDINSSMNSDTSNVVSGFMLIPINFFSTIIQSFQNQCAQVCIGECGGSSGGAHDNAWRFIFPCINLESLVGSTIYGLIDILFAFGMLFAFIRSVKNFLYKALMLTNDAASEVGVFL